MRAAGVSWPMSLAITSLVVLGGCATTRHDAGTAGIPTATPSPIVAPKRAAEVSVKKAATPAPTARTRPTACKIRSDSVEWVHLSGGCRNGHAHGAGEARSTDGQRRYRGGFANGYFHGEGRHDWGDDAYYVGTFQRGAKTGRGAVVYPDNRKYAGQFQDGLYHGTGMYTDADGSTYEGEFRAGRFHGRGAYAWANGDRYMGQFRDDLMDGEGRYTRANGENYDGQFKSNQRHGAGTYRWPNGDRYAGEFRDNEINGEGIYIHADGSKFTGQFLAGKKHGAGRLASAQGELRQRWEHGLMVAEDKTPAGVASEPGRTPVSQPSPVARHPQP